MQKIIGFSGKKGSGKDTLAKFLFDNSIDLFGVEASIHSFAGPMKNVCIDLFGLEYDQVFGTDDDKNTLTKYKWEDFPVNTENKTGFLSAREFLQEFGTAIVRKMNPNVHIEACFRKIKKEKSALNFITDVRFPNEVEAIQKLGGIVIRLTRGIYNDQHCSELLLDNKIDVFDLVLDNKTLNKFQQSQVLVDKLKGIGWINL